VILRPVAPRFAPVTEPLCRARAYHWKLFAISRRLALAFIFREDRELSSGRGRLRFDLELNAVEVQKLPPLLDPDRAPCSGNRMGKGFMKNLRPLIMVCFAAAALMVALALVGSARPEVQSMPSVMLTVNGVIDGFAMDGGRFVYAGGQAPDIGGCPSVELGSFGNKVHKRLAAEVLGAPGGDSCNAYPLLIALGGTRAVWGGFVDCCISAYGSVTTGAPGTKPRDLDGLGQTYHDTDGDFLTGVAGDGRSRVYAIVTVEVVRNFDGCFPATEPPPGPQTCDFKVRKWKVKRVVGRRAIRVPDAPPAALIDVSGGQIALVPADQRTATCNDASLGSCLGSEPRALQRFEIRSLGGSLLTRQSLNGTPTAIALSDGFVAVLVRKAGSVHIDRYDSRSGALIGRTSVPVATANEIGISDAKIVYRVKKAIRVIDARTGVQTSVAVAKATPIGLGIEGRRIAWAENVKGRGRIMSLISPT
jgi:hypothetical protein